MDGVHVKYRSSSVASVCPLEVASGRKAGETEPETEPETDRQTDRQRDRETDR